MKTVILHIAKPVSGVGVYINLVCKYINPTKFENHIICNKNDNNISLKDSYGNNIKNYHVKLEREISNINDFNCLIEIIKLIKKINPNIIHCHSAKAGVLGRIAGNYLKIPTFYTPHAYSYLSSKNTLKQFIFKLIEKSFKNTNSKTLACSLSEYNRTINDLNFKPSNVVLWNNSIPKIETSSPLKKELKIPEEFICAIGRPSYQKNTTLLIKAIYKAKQKIKNIHLVILGVGLYSPLLEEVKKLIQTLNLEKNISLITMLPRAEALSIVQKSLFFVATSRYEGLPYAVIEALALSKACILTNVDGNKDLVENDSNGFLVNEEENDIAQKIIELYSNSKKLALQSAKSYEKFIANFNIEHNIKKLEDIYLNSTQS